MCLDEESFSFPSGDARSRRLHKTMVFDDALVQSNRVVAFSSRVSTFFFPRELVDSCFSFGPQDGREPQQEEVVVGEQPQHPQKTTLPQTQEQLREHAMKLDATQQPQEQQEFNQQQAKPIEPTKVLETTRKSPVK